MDTENVASTATQEPAAPLQSLAVVVTDMLSAGGHPNPANWMMHMHPDGNIGNFEQQRNAVNGAFQHILGIHAFTEKKDTFNERYCLLDRGDRDSWIVTFRDGVLPCILKNQLPKPPQQ